MTTTITRRQLQDAIEAGITAAEGIHDFSSSHAERLRAVGRRTMVVARGTFSAVEDDRRVRCPVGQAIPDWPSWDYAWNLRFTSAYDASTWRMVYGDDLPGFVLHITEDDNEVEAA